MIRGMVIVNKKTKERKLFLEEGSEKHYIQSLLFDSQSNREKELPFELCPFEKMTDDEKIKVLEFNYYKMKDFEDSISGTGRTYSNEISLDFRTFEWMFNKYVK